MADLSLIARGFPATSGVLGLLSSDEFTEPVSAFDRLLIAASGRRIGVIYCADHSNEKISERNAKRHLGSLGAEPFALDMHADGELPSFDLAYIPGGSPKDLLQCLLDNPRWKTVRARWENGAGIAGSSAGTMALSTHCLVPNHGAGVPTRWTRGLGPIETVGFAVHASSRSREWLDDVARDAPVPVVALDDATGIVIENGRAPVVVGGGTAWFAGPDPSL